MVHFCCIRYDVSVSIQNNSVCGRVRDPRVPNFLYIIIIIIIIILLLLLGTAVAQWLRCCATNRKVAGSIPAGVSGFFVDIKSFRSHYGPGVDSAFNIN